MKIFAMKTKFLVLGLLSLCLVLSCFHGVSSQDDGTRGLSNLDLFERDYQDSVNNLQGKEDGDQSPKIQSENQNSTVTDKTTISLSLADEPETTQVGSGSNETVTRSSLLDQIESEFEAHLNNQTQAVSDGVKAESKDEAELSAQRQKMLEEMERDFEVASASLKEKIGGEGTDEESAKRKSLLEEIEREFEAATEDLKQLKVNDFTGGKDEGEQSAIRKSMLEAIEREFEAAIGGLEELASDSTGSKDDAELSAKRLSMLEEIEKEFEAATKSLEQLKGSDATGDKVEGEQVATRANLLEEIEREFEAATESLKQLQTGDKEQIAKRQNLIDEMERDFEAALKRFSEGSADDEQSAARKKMLEDIEREFEAATKSLEQLSAFTGSSDNDEQSAQRKSLLEEIEREFEAAIGELKQMKVGDPKISEEQSAMRKTMLEEMERELEEAHSDLASKITTEDSSKKQSCGCDAKINEDGSIIMPTKLSIDEVLSEESATQGTETSPSLTASLTQLVENHRKEKDSSNEPSSSSTSESSVTTETVETLRAKLKELRGLSARELVARKDFDQIVITAARFEELSGAPVSYISRLAKYRNIIKEGLEASDRVHIAQARANMFKEAAAEKQKAVDSHYDEAKSLAQKGDALHVRIFAIKKLLKQLETEKEGVDGKYKEIVKNLSHLLADASEAYEEYHGAVRNARDEQAAEEFAKEATQSAEVIWTKFLNSL